MKTCLRFAALGAAVVTTVLAMAPAAAWAGPGRSECVGAEPGCLPTLSAALAAAADGETIRLGPGRYRGGVTIAKSVHLIGAGGRRTAIVGGGPVVTITPRANGSRPTVTLADLALTGGTSTTCAILCGGFPDGSRGFGGGLYITPTSAGHVGATVSLTRVWVHRNRATATRTVPFPGPDCPNGVCLAAQGAGGGIANSGRLTVIDSRIDHNSVDGPISDADGGGIYSQIGSLTLESSTLADNHARPQRIARFAEGGGMFIDSGGLHVTDTTISQNSADLVTSYPVNGPGGVIVMVANSGGIHVGDGAQVTITRSRFVGNSITAVDPRGEPAAFDSAMITGNSTVAIDRTEFVHNTVYANTATNTVAGESGNVVEFDGPAQMTRSRISDNNSTSVSQTGPAGASAGLAVYDFYNDPRQVTVTDSAITDNHAYAYSTTDAATDTGGGVLNNSLLDLNGDTISGNTLRTAGPDTTSQGGGIWNGVLYSGPPVRLRLTHTRVTDNTASAANGGSSQGGGLYTTFPFTRAATTITGNHPDNVFQVPAGSQSAATQFQPMGRSHRL